MKTFNYLKMKVLLYILLLSLPIYAVSQNNNLLIESHLKKLKNAKTYALEIANKLSEEKFDFRPVKAEMSFKEQLLHIGENLYWLSSTFIGEQNNPLKDKKHNASEMNKDEVLQFLESAFDYSTKVISELQENTLSKTFNWGTQKLNKYQFLNLIQDHKSHHVGQLIVYLRLNNVEPPKYIGW